MNKRTIEFNVYGKLIILIGILVAFPILIIPFYPQDIIYINDFLIPAIIAIILGVLVGFVNHKKQEPRFVENSKYQESIIVIFTWAFGFILGALPFVIGKQLNFIQALFEAVSGWTTTGLSVLNVVDLSHIFLFHRAFMQFCGGLGFIMMMILIIHDKQSMNLYNAEGHPDKIEPNLKKTTQVIFYVYMAFLFIGIVSYSFVGMPLFDSVINTMCALSTGGFSNKLASIGEYNNFMVEFITIILMLIGTTNFAVLLLIAKRKWKQFSKVSEVRFMFLVLLLMTSMIVVILISYGNTDLMMDIRQAVFGSVSALSTTGYSTVDYAVWPVPAIGLMIVMMLIGGGIGSTAGGIKLTRVYLLIRVTFENMIKKVSSSRRVSSLQYTRAQGKTLIDHEFINDTVCFTNLYLFIFIVGSILITLAANCSLMDAMFEFASSLGTVGLSIGITNAYTNSATLIIEIIGMILGRLEIIIVFTGIYSMFRISNRAVKAKYQKLIENH